MSKKNDKGTPDEKKASIQCLTSDWSAVKRKTLGKFNETRKNFWLTGNAGNVGFAENIWKVSSY